MIARPEPPALDTPCAICGREFTDTHAMREVGEDIWVHSHKCEGWTLEPIVNAPLVFAAGLIGFFGGVLLLEALGWLRDAAVVAAFVALLVLAWPVSGGES